MVSVMSEPGRELTRDEVRDRMRAAGLSIAEERLDMVRVLLSTALAPVRALDSRAVRTLEPAVTFDAGAHHGDR
jgi:hypothetical protein